MLFSCTPRFIWTSTRSDDFRFCTLRSTGCQPTVIRQVREPSRDPAASNGSSEPDGVLTVSIELN
jgi:hypothetical protein